MKERKEMKAPARDNYDADTFGDEMKAKKSNKDAPISYATNISGIATAMANSFEDYSNEDYSGLTLEGYSEIKHIFGLVPEKDRAEVYMEFCKILFDRGIPYQNVMAQ